MKRFNQPVYWGCWLLVVFMVMAGCQRQETPADELGGGFLGLEDPLGFSVSVRPDDLTSIVALTPAVTGILIDLGLADELVAVDTHSALMFEALGDVVAVDLFNLDVESLVALAPGLIIAHDMIAMGNMTDDPLQPLRDLGVAVAYLPAATSFEDISRDIHFLGTLTQRIDEAMALAANFQRELLEIADLVMANETHPTVYFEISPVPDLFTFGGETFQQAMIEKAGAVNVFADQVGWFPVEAESVVASNPDVILTNAGWMADPVADILGRSGWEGMNAISNERVYYIDENASSIPNHHVVIALRMMVQALHGDVPHE